MKLKSAFLWIVLILLLSSAVSVQASNDGGKDGVLLAAPNLLEPINNAVFNHPSDFVEFEWSFVSGATKYKIVVRDQTLQTVVFRKTVTAGLSCLDSCGYIPTDQELAFFKDNHLFSWKVTAISDTERAKSTAFKFTTEIDAAITLNSPDDGLIYGTRDEIVGFTWTYTGKLDKFRLIIKNAATGVTVLSKSVNVGTIDCGEFFCAYYLTVQDQAVFGKNKSYKWRVKGMNPLGKVKSTSFTFQTMFSG